MSEAAIVTHRELMTGLQVVHLQFDVTAVDDIGFGAQPGSDLRGALYRTMERNFCGTMPMERTPAHLAICPVCQLLAAEAPAGPRGKDIPRALTLEPPLMPSPINAGTKFSFGVSLIGCAEQALLYVVRAVELMGHGGVGRGRGRFSLDSVVETSPLSGGRRTLLVGRTVLRPELAVDASAIDATIEAGPSTRLLLELLTPLSLTRAGKPVTSPEPVALIQRLLERCQGLADHYSVNNPNDFEPRAQWRNLHNVLGDIAARVSVENQDVRWIQARSGSREKNRYSSISGLMGRMAWTGELEALLPWLYWGQSLHVGKNAVKGNGWYRVWR